ncbi:DUF6602 domain-containing protein [Neotabrizicola sp. sgz301269]|uniref:DUF6602 domain-containing protein n=1 Tax=Neotabrizicola sp. sgz301269 TaxID=3276282 RepID=UPI0037701D6C
MATKLQLQGNALSDLNKGLRVRRFFEIEAKSILENYKIIETLLPNEKTAGSAHRGEEGRFIESLIRSFLNKHLPKSLVAVSGFILRPSTKTGIQNIERVIESDDQHSSQLDIIIYDVNSYPVYERFEEFCIVPPEGVIGIISVKKKLYNSQIKDEIDALKSAAFICRDRDRRGPFTALVSFSAEEKEEGKLNKRIFEAISEAHKNSAFDPMVNEVSVLARTCVFKVRRENAPANNARYVSVDCRNEQHIPLQRMLQSLMSVYYDDSRMTEKLRPGFVSFKKATFKDSPEIGLVPILE